jgi:hypothetical protein
MLCARCSTENSAGARFCNTCGSPLAPVAEKPSGPPLTPHAEKEFEKPVAAVAFGVAGSDASSAQTEGKPRNKSGSISDGPLDLRHIPTDQPVRATKAAPARASGAKPWQWALAIVSGALFLYNASYVIALGLLRLGNSSLPTTLTNNLGVYAALAGAGCCGLALAMPDMKSSVTTIAGGVFIRSLLGLVLGSSAAARQMAVGLLVLGGLSAIVLWWLWLDRPRERGDSARMSMALTILVSAEALSAAFGYASHPAQFQVRRIAILAMVIGSLLGLRAWIPGAIGDGGRRV